MTNIDKGQIGLLHSKASTLEVLTLVEDIDFGRIFTDKVIETAVGLAETIGLEVELTRIDRYTADAFIYDLAIEVRAYLETSVSEGDEVLNVIEKALHELNNDLWHESHRGSWVWDRK